MANEREKELVPFFRELDSVFSGRDWVTSDVTRLIEKDIINSVIAVINGLELAITRDGKHIYIMDGLGNCEVLRVFEIEQLWAEWREGNSGEGDIAMRERL